MRAVSRQPSPQHGRITGQPEKGEYSDDGLAACKRDHQFLPDVQHCSDLMECFFVARADNDVQVDVFLLFTDEKKLAYVSIKNMWSLFT